MAKDENKKVKKVKKENKNGLKNFKAELKKVVWPTPKQLANNTIAVITIVLITTVIVFALDFTFEKMNEYGIEKLKSSVQFKNETNSIETENKTVDNNGNLTENNSENKTEGEETVETTLDQNKEGTDSQQQTTDNQVAE